jgi:antitoxin component of MazEF toxin-antitoxin module
MTTQIAKWGNSLGLRLPKAVLQEAASTKAIAWTRAEATTLSQVI